MLRTSEIKPLLERLYGSFDFALHVERDPLKFLHRYQEPRDVEVVGLISASLAFGRVRAFCGVLEPLLSSLGPHPAEVLGDMRGGVGAADCGAGYRWLQPQDLRAMLEAIGRALREAGSLQALFASHDEGGEDTWKALGGFLMALRRWAAEAHEDAEGRSRALAFLFPSVHGDAACKRQHLFLRWMARSPKEGADLCLWTGIEPARLVIPCDVHVGRIGHALGLASKPEPGRSTADEITRNLRLVDPVDPVRFDFALAHLGISSGCRAQPISSVCTGCGLRTACRWWGK